MKKLLLFTLIAILFSCKEKTTSTTTKQEEKQEVKAEKNQNFDWLLGKWKRTNDEEGKQTYENWHKKSDLEYVGLGFTMKENDTISKEIMKISKANDKWNLIVVSRGKEGDNSPVNFKISSNDKNSFTCENKEIDFPNIIHYKRFSNTMKATIANSEMSIPFVFKLITD